MQKFLAAILLSVLILALLVKPASAFSPGTQGYQFYFENAVFKTQEMNLESFVYNVWQALIASMIHTPLPCVICSRAQRETGAIETMTNLIAAVYTYKPASGIEYLADVGSRLGVVKPTYAQGPGLGFVKMGVFLPIWRAFRNIAYSFFIIIFVLIGFAIMFRVKISPQAVITIQSALPRIIFALILVTFSYAIVGFLIDLMWIINNLIMVTFRNIPHGASWLVNRPVTSDIETVGIILTGTTGPFSMVMVILLLLVIIGFIGTFAGGGAAAPIGVPILAIGSIVLFLVALIFLIALIRLFWTLLKAYVNVVLGLIFAPFQILLGTLPGSNAVGSWFKNIIANLAVLPIVLIMIFLANYLIWASIARVAGLPEAVGAYQTATGEPTQEIKNIQQALANPSAIDAVGALIIMFFVSLGLLLMTPKVADMIQAYLAGKPFGYGAAIGEALGEPPKYALRGISIATEIGKAWTTRFGTLPGSAKGPPAGGLPTPETT